jgi:hypothetical protein
MDSFTPDTCVGRSSCLDVVVNIKIPASVGNQISVFQHIDRHFNVGDALKLNK